ncbi:MAG TPA: LytTR family DNA-binding domain-containing protein [Pyrinomonadaceae bacterium]|nr:LytTR family DNA-binding domain-containing protein [Pyrinomonadaceae bacterium]
MEKISALIVDDEKPARQRLRELLEKERSVAVVGECASGAEAVRLIREREPELLFLDIQMPVMGGFEVVEEVGAGSMPVTVFVTAYDAYAVKAFDASALDYLLKPYSDERFDRCLTRALAHVRTQKREEMSRRLINVLAQEPEGARSSSGGHLERLLVKAGGRVLFLPADDIDWIEAAGVYVQLHAAGRKFLHRASLNDLEAALDPQRFIRIHRSAIVNLQRVQELYPHSHGDYVAVLKDGTRLKLSRSYRPKLETRLRQSL